MIFLDTKKKKKAELNKVLWLSESGLDKHRAAGLGEGGS